MKEGFVTYKQIKGHEGRYMISDHGDLVTLNRRNPTIRKKTYAKGYVRFRLCLGSATRFMQKDAHRLVAEAFIPNPENKKEVHHINSIKSDNRACNLMWVDKRQNMNEHYKNNKQYGITFCKQRKKWRARIKKGTWFYLGDSENKIAAQWFFDDAYFCLYGCFPRGE